MKLPLIFNNQKRSFALLVISALITVVFAYWQIPHVPFYLDDFGSIIDNQVIKQPYNFIEIWQIYKARFITYASFSAQFLFFGDNASGYHMVGMFLHFLVATALYLFTRALFKLGSATKRYQHITALAVSFLFLIHPQNTQATIYIAQQATLWAALFYITCMLCFIKVRCASNQKTLIFWSLCFLLTFAAMPFTKQNAATVPLALLAVEWLFFGAWLKRILTVYTIGGIGLCIAVCYTFGHSDLANTIQWLDSVSRENQEISRLGYFRSQLNILFHYISQFMWPTNLRLEYDFTVVKAWDLATLFSGIFHILLIGGLVLQGEGCL